MPALNLVIGHNDFARKALAKSIDQTGLFSHTVICGCGSEIMHFLKTQAIDMIFYRADHAEGNVFTWIQWLKNNMQCSNIPVMVFSGDDRHDEKIRSLEAGANDCLPLNISGNELKLRITRHLNDKKQIEQLQKANEELSRQSLTDGLTGLHNRRFLNMVLNSETARSQRSDEPFSVMMVDADHFKLVNDRFGHLAGDEVLQVIAEVLKDCTRKTDTVCRYGGEEFSIILPGATAENAYSIAERIRKRIANLSRKELPIPSPVTVSIGISCFDSKTARQPEDLLKQADRALYRAKQNSRNRTEIYKKAPGLLPKGLFEFDLAGALA